MKLCFWIFIGGWGLVMAYAAGLFGGTHDIIKDLLILLGGGLIVGLGAPYILVKLPEKRVKNFEEVELGYNDKEALKEANRCLQCKNPRCVYVCIYGLR